MLTNHSLAKILELFHSRKSFHVREVARQTGLNQNSVVHFLKILEKESILESRKDANLKKYVIRCNKKACAILTILDTEKLERLCSSKKAAIDMYMNSLPPVIFAVMFQENSKSDMIVLLVTYEKIDTKKAIISKSDKIRTIQISYDDFVKELKWKENAVIQMAIDEGLPILNHIKYYETIMSPTRK